MLISLTPKIIFLIVVRFLRKTFLDNSATATSTQQASSMKAESVSYASEIQRLGPSNYDG